MLEEPGVFEEASDGDGASPLLGPTRPHQYPASAPLPPSSLRLPTLVRTCRAHDRCCCSPFASASRAHGLVPLLR